ncbi:deoxyribose-phosphate aldolase [Halanaerobiaceae bacterium Z-7014]|uniref:Deoxyribose-phosphate aldolase n=1 Tax=Halonatronomonas betaini TaxID=2778430 RepID=A0A931F7K4_9FIRM|nr:deoxyribose-phosphate aldolase [Halonatronomonas betaini]MBF8435583.1 deoxyribose-phosphate aldolase [Halonatronomonas betaini]
MENHELSKMLDHTLLGQDINKNQVINKCNEAKEYGFYSVFTVPYYVKTMVDELKGSNVKVGTVVGFPLGNTNTESKVQEAIKALKDGAEELDMVINISALKDHDRDYIFKDINEIVKLKDKLDQDFILKVIIESCLLDPEEIEEVNKLVYEAGADYIKTSTGFAESGASLEVVKLLADLNTDNDLKIKASGGIRTKEDALAMIKAGADRIGVSSGVQIINS